MANFRGKIGEKKKIQQFFWLEYGIFPFVASFLAMGIFLGLFSAYDAYAEERSGSGTITIGAVVPFRAEFAAAVAKSSTLLGESNFGKVGQTQKGSVIVSNEGVILKNQKVSIDLINKKGEIIYSEEMESGSDGRAEWEITLTETMLGRNSVHGRVMTYEQPIFLKQNINLFVWLEISTLRKLLKTKILGFYSGVQHYLF